MLTVEMEESYISLPILTLNKMQMPTNFQCPAGPSFCSICRGTQPIRPPIRHPPQWVYGGNSGTMYTGLRSEWPPYNIYPIPSERFSQYMRLPLFSQPPKPAHLREVLNNNNHNNNHNPQPLNFSTQQYFTTSQQLSSSFSQQQHQQQQQQQQQLPIPTLTEDNINIPVVSILSPIPSGSTSSSSETPRKRGRRKRIPKSNIKNESNIQQQQQQQQQQCNGRCYCFNCHKYISETRDEHIDKRSKSYESWFTNEINRGKLIPSSQQQQQQQQQELIGSQTTRNISETKTTTTNRMCSSECPINCPLAIPRLPPTATTTTMTTTTTTTKVYENIKTPPLPDNVPCWIQQLHSLFDWTKEMPLDVLQFLYWNNMVDDQRRIIKPHAVGFLFSNNPNVNITLSVLHSLKEIVKIPKTVTMMECEELVDEKPDFVTSSMSWNRILSYGSCGHIGEKIKCEKEETSRMTIPDEPTIYKAKLPVSGQMKYVLLDEESYESSLTNIPNYSSSSNTESTTHETLTTTEETTTTPTESSSYPGTPIPVSVSSEENINSIEVVESSDHVSSSGIINNNNNSPNHQFLELAKSQMFLIKFPGLDGGEGQTGITFHYNSGEL